MQLLARGQVGYVFSYSFLITDKIGEAAEIERWHRQRAHIEEERIKGAKNGCGLVHLPLREGRPPTAGARRERPPTSLPCPIWPSRPRQ